MQNSVDFRDLGAATSGVTFFRSIGGSFGVSVFGAIVLGGNGTGLRHGVTLETLATTFGGAGTSLAGAFRWVFVAAAGCLTVGLVCLLMMEERPLRGRQQSPAQPMPAE